METKQKMIIERELQDILTFLKLSGINLENMEIGYIKTALSIALTEGYLLATKESTRKVEEINF